MIIYWDFTSIPELHGLPRDQQEALYWEARRAHRQHPRIRASLPVQLALVFTVMLLAAFLPVPGLVRLLVVIFGPVPAYLLSHHLAMPVLRPWLAARRTAMEAQPIP